MFFSFAEAKRYLSGYGTRKLKISDYYKAGGFAWFTGTFFEGPIDIVKCQLQSQIIKQKTTPGYVPQFTTAIDCAKYIIKKNGFLGLYQGFLPHVARNVPSGAIHLGTFEALRLYGAHRRKCEVKDLPTLYVMVSGAIGGCLYWGISFPLDVLKSTIQSDALDKAERRFQGTLDCAIKLYREGGISRFYRGFTPCMLRASPANAIMLWTVSFITDRIPISITVGGN
jgi:solute carrier family 25 carnitine/acylcarnitine transporter 20/29